MKHPVYIACGMSGGKDYGAAPFVAVIVLYARDRAFRISNEVLSTGVEMDFAAASQYGATDSFDYFRQLVSTDVRMYVDENIFRSPVLAQPAENGVYRTAFFASCVQLAIGISPGAAFFTYSIIK